MIATDPIGANELADDAHGQHLRLKGEMKKGHHTVASRLRPK